MNLFEAAFEYDPADPSGYKCGAVHLTRALGASELAVKWFEIPPGEAVCPYHYEYVEEWLIVLGGTVVVRVPDGEVQAPRGHVMAFAAGPAGGHKLINRGDTVATALMFSSAREPAVAVYPDSDKIGVWTGNPDDNVILRRADGHIDYYDGEVG